MHKNVFVGGTFDIFHKGHVALLTTAFGVGDLVTIGLTSDAYINKFKNTPHRSYSERLTILNEWLAKNGHSRNTQIIAIDNPFEPAATGEYSALVVTSDNRFRGDEINALRDQKGLTPLTLILAPLVAAEDGLPISSSRVRKGLIDANGRLVMPEVLRAELQEPLGKLLDESEVVHVVNSVAEKITISVGDITTTKLMQLGLVPTLSIIDLLVSRKPYQTFEDYRFPPQTSVVRVTSGPGFLTEYAMQVVKNWSESAVPHKSTVIIVEGEEDLMTLPAIIYAPIGSTVFYGQPDLLIFTNVNGSHEPIRKGMVEVVVSRESKERAIELLAKFSKK